MTTGLQESSQQVSFMEIPGCEFTPVSLTLPTGLTFDQWERIGRQLQLADMAIQWWIGDWLVYGEHKWREKYAQAIEVTGKKEQTLMNYRYVAKAISPSRRRENVEYSTHAEVASLDEDEQERILARAAKENMTRNAVRREADKTRRAKMPKVEDDAVLLSREAREFLDDYMTSTAEWTERIPEGLPVRERQAIEKMIFGHGANALWLHDLTRAKEFKAITQLFSFEEGVPSTERAEGNHIFSYLEKSGYYLGEDELIVALESMVDKKMLQVLSVEDSRQEGRRGTMNDLYGLDPTYEDELERQKLKERNGA